MSASPAPLTASLRVLSPMDVPPIIEPITKRPEKRSRTPLLIVLVCVGVLGGCFVRSVVTRWPPKETELIANFHAHRGAYERLRAMLQEDVHVFGVGPSGVTTTNSMFPGNPQSESIPVDRYKAYLNLLKEVGGDLVTRPKGQHAGVSVFVWGWGWAGCSRNIGVSWEPRPPTNQVATLFGKRPKQSYAGRQVFYKHLEEHWYLWADF